MSRPDRPRLAILGAGPIGLEAALYAAQLGMPFTVYERGRVGENVQQWGHVRLFSPFGMNSTPLGRRLLSADQPRRKLPAEGELLTGRHYLEAYLAPLAELPALRDNLRLGTTVLHVGRKGLTKDELPGDPRRGQQPFRLLLLAEDGSESVEEADVVLDCTGTYGQRRWLGDGGIPALGEQQAHDHIAGGLEDVLGERRGHYADRTTLVVGAGHSAATTVLSLATLAVDHPSTWIIWAARGQGTQPLRRLVNDPLRERDQLAARANHLATRGEGNVEFHPQTTIEQVEWRGEQDGFCMVASCAGTRRTWEVDRIIANVGYVPDLELCRELQVALCPATEGSAAGAGADSLSPPGAGLRTGEPGFFVLGTKSYGRNASFLMRNGFEQVAGTFALITGRADLDLYRKR